MKIDTKTQILESAERMTKLKGFDAFSYRDISEEVGIKTSSIHYYFPTKSDLATALVDRYTASFLEIFEDLLGQNTSGFERMKGLFNVVASVSGDDKNFCLCGMLAADIHTISETGKSKLAHFFNRFESGIERLLKDGLEDGSIHSSIRPKSSAIEMTATIEGAMLIARVKNRETYLNDALDIVLARIRA